MSWITGIDNSVDEDNELSIYILGDEIDNELVYVTEADVINMAAAFGYGLIKVGATLQ